MTRASGQGVEERYEGFFRRWLEGVGEELALSLPEAGPGDWIREVYRDNGGLTAERLAPLVSVRREEIAREAFAVLVEELSGATGLPAPAPPEAVGPSEDAPTGTVGVYHSSILALDRAEVYAEVADAVQTYAADRHRTVWPQCADHRTGVQVRTGRREAFWWCRAGGHEHGAIFREAAGAPEAERRG